MTALSHATPAPAPDGPRYHHTHEMEHGESVTYIDVVFAVESNAPWPGMSPNIVDWSHAYTCGDAPTEAQMQAAVDGIPDAVLLDEAAEQAVNPNNAAEDEADRLGRMMQEGQ